MRTARRAFTLIELLIVISVIAILASILLATINMVRQAALVGKTRAIMHAVITGISASAMRTQLTISPSPHPLANTAPTRSLFLRGQAVATRFAVGDTVATTGEALVTDDATTLAASESSRVMMPTDRYCGLAAPDTDSPMLFGMERRYLTVLGSGLGLVTVRRLPAPSSWNDRNQDNVLDSPPYVASPGVGQVAYLDNQFLVTVPGSLASTTLFEIDAKKLFDIALGPEVMTELATLGGIRTADDASGAAVGSVLISNNRLRSWPAPAPASYTSFDRQGAKQRSLVLDGATWKPYRLRGAAIYDAWQHEVLFYTAENGSFCCESAGKNGLFRWDPGRDNVFQTSAASDTPSGDDFDASKDNILTGQK